jgi:hypothetical protein
MPAKVEQLDDAGPEPEATCPECGAYASERCEPDCSARMEYASDKAAEAYADFDPGES